MRKVANIRHFSIPTQLAKVFGTWKIGFILPSQQDKESHSAYSLCFIWLSYLRKYQMLKSTVSEPRSQVDITFKKSSKKAHALQAIS